MQGTNNSFLFIYKTLVIEIKNIYQNQTLKLVKFLANSLLKNVFIYQKYIFITDFNIQIKIIIK